MILKNKILANFSAKFHYETDEFIILETKNKNLLFFKDKDAVRKFKDLAHKNNYYPISVEIYKSSENISVEDVLKKQNVELWCDKI